MNAPPIKRSGYSPLIAAHFIFGGLMFATALVLLFLSANSLRSHYFSPPLLAVTHCMTLGFITSIIFGSLYQFLPVITERSYYSRPLIFASSGLLFSGSILLVIAFWGFNTGVLMQAAALILFLSLTLFCINTITTCLHTRSKAPAIKFIFTSCLWLWITALAGTIVVFAFSYDILSKDHIHYLNMHAHTGLVGWILMLSIGVASKLVTMFLLSQKINSTILNASFWLINIGLLLLTLQTVFSLNVYPIVYAGSIVAGVMLFLFFIRQSYTSRLRKIIDSGMKASVVGVLLLVLPSLFVLIAGMTFMQLPSWYFTLYGIMLLFGVFSLLIQGQTFKILPFIFWMEHRDKKQLPNLLPRDLVNWKMASTEYFLYAAGIAGLLAGLMIENTFMIQTSLAFCFLSSLLFIYQMTKIVSFKNTAS